MPPKSLSRALGCFAVSVVLLQLFGCHGTTEPTVANGVTVRIQTDQRRYSFSTDQGVHVTMVNTGSQPVYTELPSFFVSLERMQDGRWQSAGVWYAIVAVAPRVVPFATGDSLPARVSMLSSVLRHNGTYRFVYQLYEDSRLSQPLPPNLLRSNTFEVVD